MQMPLFVIEDPVRPLFKFRKSHIVKGSLAEQSLSLLALAYALIEFSKCRTLSSALLEAGRELDLCTMDSGVVQAVATAVAEFTGASLENRTWWAKIQTLEKRTMGRYAGRTGPTLPQADLLEIVAGAAQKCYVPKRKEN